MNFTRNLLATLAGAAAGLAFAAALLQWGPRVVGVSIAVAAACVILWFLVRAVQASHRRMPVVDSHHDIRIHDGTGRQYRIESIREVRDGL